MPNFPGLTSRTSFPAEACIPPHLLSIRQVWPLDTYRDPLSCAISACTQRVEAGGRLIVLKPSGQVSEISKGGYSLTDALGLEEAQYRAVQVRGSFDFIHFDTN